MRNIETKRAKNETKFSLIFISFLVLREFLKWIISLDPPPPNKTGVKICLIQRIFSCRFDSLNPMKT